MTNNTAPGEGTMQTQAARIVRILVVLNNFPQWDDVSPTRTRYDAHSNDRNHPMHSNPETANLYTPGGPLSTSDYNPNGLAQGWTNTGINPSGSGSGTANHPRIEYNIEGRKGTSIDLRERWFTFLFDQANPNSVTNYYWENSNGNLRIQGNRSDVRGPLETKHILDRIPYGGSGYDYAVQPGTPIIRRVAQPATPRYPGVPNLRGISADSGQDIIGTLGYSGGVGISGLQIITAAELADTTDDSTQWDPLAVSNVYPDQFDGRRRIYKTAAFAPGDGLRARVGGVLMNIPIDAGFSLDNDQGTTLFTRNDTLDSAEGNRLLSMCYYTHDHSARNGQMGSRPYQLRHMRNSSGVVDDICGTAEDARDRFDRPKPWDHDIVDHAQPNYGYFEGPESNGGHTYGVWLGHLNTLMVEEGISTDGYQSIIHLYPSDAAGTADTGGTSGPWSGLHVFIPNSAVVLPSDAGLVVTAHELGHNLNGFPDLYDTDFYTNARGHVPPLDDTNMIGPYSVMAKAGGVRVDAFLKTLVGWVQPIALTQDMLDAPLPQIEGTLQDPVVYKLPGRPHYIPMGVPPEQWEEYFLVENRNKNGAEYFGDPSPKGTYIYHVDLRFGQTDEDHPMVIVEQADGLFELERNRVGNVGDLPGDPFPGSLGIRDFTQYTNPGSQSHGFMGGTASINTVEPPTPPAGYLANGTETDSFSRVCNISDAGATMRMNLHVVPREVIVTQVAIPDQPSQVPQGTKDFLVQRINLNNDGVLPNFSMGDVELASLRVDESGSSQRDADVDRASLFDDTDANGEFDPAVDTRIATTTFQSQSAFFTNLNYRIPLNETRDLFLTYDIAEGASTKEGNSVGASMRAHDYVRPEVPGAVQERVRTPMSPASAGLGAYRFPINSSTVDIIEDPDTLTITPVSRTPVAIEPGDVDVPILSLNCEVDQDSVHITRVRVDQTGTMDGVAHITAAKLFIDNNADGQVDPGDTLLEETTFASSAGVQRATFDFAANPVAVVDGSVRSLLLAATLSDQLPLQEPPLTLQYTLVDPTYVSLVQSVDIVADTNFPMSSDAVSTPLPNNPPAAPQNVAALVLANGSIMLGWDLSADDPDVGGEADVVHYNIYRSADPADFATVTPVDAITTVGAGETEYNDTTAPLGTPVYYMMRAWDGVQEGPNSNVAGPVTAADAAPPVFSAFDPAQDATGVPLDTNISFVMSDTGSGIDDTTLVFQVNGVDVAGATETTITGSARQRTVVYDPPADFDFLDTVGVVLQVSDLSGNEASMVSYEFTITGPPVHFIAGVVTDGNGDPVADVQVDAGGLSAMTNAQGQYQIQGLAAGSYTVVPTKAGVSFQPEQRAVTVPPDAVAIDFSAQQGFAISGSVVDQDGDPVSGVTVTDGSHIVVTGADGLWAFTDIPAGTYTIIPSLTGSVFTPATIDATVNATDGDSTGNEFVAVVETFDVTGTLRTPLGERIAGVEVQARQNGAVVATAVTNANGVYSIADLLPGSYVIAPEDEDFSFNPEQRQVDVATDMSNIDFIGAGIYSFNLPAGLRFVGLPIRPLRPAPEDVFGANVDVARWDPQAARYELAPSTNPIMEVAPGAGFWTNSAAQRALQVPGTLFGSTQDLTVNVARTWNMLGNPYDRDLPWERLTLPQGVSRYGFIYDTAAGTYRLVSTTAGLGTVTTVPRNAGFWLRAEASTHVAFDGPGTAAVSSEVAQLVERKPADDAWIIPVVARGAGALDACSFAGVLPQAASDPAAYQMDNPPAIGPYVDLYFLGEDGRRLAVDVRAVRPIQTWQFEVVTDTPGAEIELQLPDLSEVPADKAVYLVDETAGKRIYARTLTTYSYQAGEGARRFRLEVADRSETGLMITAASAQAAGNGITVSYTLSADAQVLVEVLNIAGRKVATLDSDEAAPAGVSTCTWNGRGGSGTSVPAGRYLVRISARTADGQQVQSLVPVQLER
jgi:protocatechuate 3,4-dioxygenase beta subunit